MRRAVKECDEYLIRKGNARRGKTMWWGNQRREE
jgi:hypothetical protein